MIVTDGKGRIGGRYLPRTAGRNIQYFSIPADGYRVIHQVGIKALYGRAAHSDGVQQRGLGRRDGNRSNGKAVFCRCDFKSISGSIVCRCACKPEACSASGQSPKLQQVLDLHPVLPASAQRNRSIGYIVGSREVVEVQGIIAQLHPIIADPSVICVQIDTDLKAFPRAYRIVLRAEIEIQPGRICLC